MKSVYTEVPIFENDEFMLRKVSKEDVQDLIKVYSDTKSLPFFNSDNCHGDLFFYDTVEKMNKALDFWARSYEKKQFERWSIINKKSEETIGTIELFHRDSQDYFSNCGVLRLDLRSDYENVHSIISILNLIVPYTFELFDCDKIAIKAVETAIERRDALRKMAFFASQEVVKGNDGISEYGSYFVKLENMKNPWEEINLSDYENHMKLDTVKQLQSLNTMMKDQFYHYPVKSIMILGIAGGNGLNHVDPQILEKIYAVDVNEGYLLECSRRYENLNEILEYLCVDLTDNNIRLPYADMIIANLLIEYIGYNCFQNIVVKTNPKYVSCIIQINRSDGFVSDSPYLHVFDNITAVHHQIDEKGLTEVMKSIGYHLVNRREMDLPNDKSLIQLDFVYFS